MEYWYLIALVDLALLAILRLRSQTPQHPYHAPDERLAAHRLSGGVVR
jgi:hypothetical protein